MRTMIAIVFVFSLLHTGGQPVAADKPVEFLNSGKVLPEGLPFSEAVRVGDTVYLSGQVGVVPGSMALAEGGIAGEARQTMENIKISLEAHGLSLRDLVKCTVMMADIAEWSAFNAVYKTYFDGTYPARSAFGTSGLAPGARVEVECIAVHSDCMCAVGVGGVMNSITVRFAGPDDDAALAAMIEGLDGYYEDPPRPAGETRVAVEAWLQSGAAEKHFAVAFADAEPVGLASIGLLYPGNGLQRLLFLKDLFVVAEQRGQGIGEALMRFLACYCRDEGIGRIDWVVETERAQRFYENLGAVEKPHKIFMRLDGQALADLAAQSKA